MLNQKTLDAVRKVAAPCVSRYITTSALGASGDCIMYTYTDEAPMLATYSFLPIIRKFTATSNLKIECPDISVAGRVLSQFPDYLSPEQRVADELGALGELAKTPAANIIKLPNVSAALPQLTDCIAELQAQGYNIPDYPVEPKNDAEREIKARYGKVIGSAVNPVLREGNSDRRVAGPVKEYAMANPKKLYPWPENSTTHVAHMKDGDFFSSEQSVTIPNATSVRIEFVNKSGDVQVMKAETPMQANELLDGSRMSIKALRAFFAEEIEKCKGEGNLLSLHLKATMMKVSDPIMFGHCLTVFFADVFEKHGATFEQLGVNPNNGLGELLEKLNSLPEAQKNEIVSDINATYERQPPLAMVDSDNGITNLHAPNDVIIDASVPPVIRDGGKMWNWGNELQSTKLLIPDRSYATQYAAIVNDCLANGNFNAATMGNVCNVGLMAQKAEEYGSHDKTFTAPADGTMRIVDNNTGAVVMEHAVETGDIWRACQTKDAPIQDWIRLACRRSQMTGDPVIFWLNGDRAHDAQLIQKIEAALPSIDLTGVQYSIMPPADAMTATCGRVRQGLNTITATGNVLRDYLTDLFPILELGTSAKMLSIVPLLEGGGLYETGAGGSAPKHVQQLVKENHLRWDSLGEFLALAVSIEDLATKTNNEKGKVVGKCLNTAVGKLLKENKGPGRKVKQLDNRDSHFWIAMYWAEALASEPGFEAEFGPLYQALSENEPKISAELMAAQGAKVDLGGYYHLDHAKAEKVMRPSDTLNGIIGGMVSN